MPQTAETGRAGREWGYVMAETVARKLGARLVSPRLTNEAEWGKKRIVLKAAHRGVAQVGATEATLNRVDWVVAALEDADGSFTLYQVSSAWFREQMVPSRSTNASHVMMVKCRQVRDAGTVVGHL